MTASGIQHRVVSLKQNDVSQVHTASVMVLVMEAVRISETSVYFKETTRRCIPESCLHTHRRENLKSFIKVIIRSIFPSHSNLH
jgi:hypothetical protein